MIDRKRNGARRIELLMPFDAGCGRIIDAIEMKPVTLDHVLRWQAGLAGDPLALLSELCGLGSDILGQLTFPDADIVMTEFALHCPPAIRSSLGQEAIVPSAVEGQAGQKSPDTLDMDLPQNRGEPGLEESDVDREMFKVA